MSADLATRLARSEAVAAQLAAAIRAFFTPGPGCAVPVKHVPDYGEPHMITWNKKLDVLEAALAAYDAAR